MTLPAGFRFGVATAGFQVEGGYNRPGAPANNWAAWEAAGRVEPSGVALDFWHDYERQLDRAASLGIDSFRLSVEWARCEPVEGQLDDGAFERYRSILRACRDRGLEPLVTLHHFTHPAWLGRDFWLDLDSPERFAAWTRTAVERLGADCSEWVTTNEPNVLALNSWVAGAFPPGGVLRIPALVRALDHLVAGHVLAYDAVKAVQPESCVATNTYSLSVYELDRLVLDVLVGRHLGVSRDELGRWLAERRGDFYRSVPSGGRVERLLRRLAATSVPLDQALPRAVAAVYGSPHTVSLDVTQLDWYDPFAARKLRLPGHRTAGGRSWQPGRRLWDDPPEPEHLPLWVEATTVPGLDVWVVENGLCNRVRGGQAFRRTDGWDRVRYLREHLAAVVAAADRGVPVRGYWHWTLGDNYEWGSYEPRFGLFGVDRSRGVTWSDVDSMGDDAAGAYRAIIEGLRAGDRSVLGA